MGNCRNTCCAKDELVSNLNGEIRINYESPPSKPNLEVEEEINIDNFAPPPEQS
jgi:hypothetical protein